MQEAGRERQGRGAEAGRARPRLRSRRSSPRPLAAPSRQPKPATKPAAAGRPHRQVRGRQGQGPDRSEATDQVVSAVQKAITPSPDLARLPGHLAGQEGSLGPSGTGGGGGGAGRRPRTGCRACADTGPAAAALEPHPKSPPVSLAGFLCFRRSRLMARLSVDPHEPIPRSKHRSLQPAGRRQPPAPAAAAGIP